MMRFQSSDKISDFLAGDLKLDLLLKLLLHICGDGVLPPYRPLEIGGKGKKVQGLSLDRQAAGCGLLNVNTTGLKPSFAHHQGASDRTATARIIYDSLIGPKPAFGAKCLHDL